METSVQRNDKMTGMADNEEPEEGGELRKVNEHTCPQVLLLHTLVESHRARRHVCVSRNIYEAKNK